MHPVAPERFVFVTVYSEVSKNVYFAPSSCEQVGEHEQFQFALNLIHTLL